MNRPIRALFVTLALLACAWPAAADSWRVETRFGTLQVGVEPTYDVYGALLLDGKLIDAASAKLDIVDMHVFDWGDRGDAVLLELSSGGSSCCTSYQFVRLSAEGQQVSEPFGLQGYEPSNFVVTPDEIRFDIEFDYPANIDHQVAHYDGTSAWVEDVLENDDGVAAAGPGDEVRRWDGQRTSDLLEAADERVRFGSIVDGEALNHLRISLYNSNPMFVDRGYLVGTGCWPHLCGMNNGYIAIDIATGRPYAAYSTDTEFKAFGAEPENLPEPLRDLVLGSEENARMSPVGHPYPMDGERRPRLHPEDMPSIE